MSWNRVCDAFISGNMQSLLDLLFVGGFDSSLTVGLRPVGDAVRARSGVRQSRLPARHPGVGGAERRERAGRWLAGAGGLQTFSSVGTLRHWTRLEYKM